MKKYYYYDNNNNKKYYIGKVIKGNNITYGNLINEKKVYNEIELEYHPEIKAEEGYNSYFIYEDGSKYTGLSSKVIHGINNTYFITDIKTYNIDLKKYDKSDYIPGYFTYIDNSGKENLYTDDLSYIKYDKLNSTYYILK